jgi:hypothetical protein
VEVTPSFAGDPAQVSWYFDGDGYGGGPHNPCSSDNYNPAGQSACDESTNLPASIPTDATGLFFSPKGLIPPAAMVSRRNTRLNFITGQAQLLRSHWSTSRILEGLSPVHKGSLFLTENTPAFL